MNNRRFLFLSIFCLTLVWFPFLHIGLSQEVGCNFNHVPENIDFKYLEKADVDWIRTTPYILDYVDGFRQIEGERGVANIIKAGERGYKVAFGYRWDFKKRDMRIPKPGTGEEKQLFAYAGQMLERVAPYVDLFKLGNEPNFETLPEDLQPDGNGNIPLIVFTRRLLAEVVEPLYEAHPEWRRPDVYVGSMVQLYEEKQKGIPATEAMIRLARETEAITGLAIHVHVKSLEQIDESFRFARAILPTKPIIVPEFSLQRLYRSKLNELVGSTSAGREFAKRYRRDPNWKLWQWFSYANTNRVSSQEWFDLFLSQPWYPENYMLKFYESFQRNGVVLATYPLKHPNTPKEVKPNSAPWFINPIFSPGSLELQPNGDYSPNPLCFEDFQTLVKRGREP